MSTDSHYQKQWQAFGYQLQFRWNSPKLEQAVLDIILPDWVESTGEPDTIFEVTTDGEKYTITQDGEMKGAKCPESLLHQSLKRICHIDLATYAPGLVFVHSGVVKTPHGLLLLPARSYSGKSTLVRSLIELGCQYYSDEYAVIDHQGHVRPFPRRLCERLEGGKTRFHRPQDLGWNKKLPPAPLVAVISTRFQTGATWSPTELSQGEAVLKMLENTVSARTEPQRAITYLAEAVRKAHCVVGPRGESQDTAPLILDWMAKL